ncbi:MAG: GTPase Era [Caldilineaceae bacterium]|nr:GTPase Era [Caldilineaceae bacterium]
MSDLQHLLDEPEESLPPDHRSGFVAVIGRPNVGKSTLLNRLLGQKIAITSPKPQTTRDQLLGILTLEDAQILFLDTPGIHKPQHQLGEHMVKVATETIDDVDVVLWLVDVNTPPTEEDQAIAELLVKLARRAKPKLAPLVLGLNKLDQADAALVDQRGAEYAALIGDMQIETMGFSGLTGLGVDELLEELRELLPQGPRYYPADQVTDLQTRFIVAELIREQALHLLAQELPHSLAVVVDEFTERDENMTYISAVLYVERETQKPIVLGQGGKMIKRIGQRARPQIEELVGTRVYLELWVKVWEKWRRREGMLRRLGYATEQRKA